MRGTAGQDRGTDREEHAPYRTAPGGPAVVATTDSARLDARSAARSPAGVLRGILRGAVRRGTGAVATLRRIAPASRKPPLRGRRGSPAHGYLPGAHPSGIR